MHKIGRSYKIFIENDNNAEATGADSMSVNWNIRSSVQLKMKMIIKRLLKKYGYPHDKRDQATKTVLEHARLMCVKLCIMVKIYREAMLRLQKNKNGFNKQ